MVVVRKRGTIRAARALELYSTCCIRQSDYDDQATETLSVANLDFVLLRVCEFEHSAFVYQPTSV